MDSSDQPKRQGQVITVYQPENPDPLKVAAGETLAVSEKEDRWQDHPDWLWVWCTDPRGKSAWASANLLEHTGEAGKAIARYSYDATELAVTVGEMLTIENEESGWFWCINGQGLCGWVPLDHVALANE